MRFLTMLHFHLVLPATCSAAESHLYVFLPLGHTCMCSCVLLLFMVVFGAYGVFFCQASIQLEATVVAVAIHNPSLHLARLEPGAGHGESSHFAI